MSGRREMRASGSSMIHVSTTKPRSPNASGRSENIVIYTHGDDASQRVLEAIAGYKAKNPSHFMTGVPAFTEQVAPGVATGDEPAVGGGQMSFGSLRAQVIESAHWATYCAITSSTEHVRLR